MAVASQQLESSRAASAQASKAALTLDEGDHPAGPPTNSSQGVLCPLGSVADCRTSGRGDSGQTLRSFRDG